MSKEPELGQMLFGNPTGNFGTSEWVDALIAYLLDEIERVHWNKYQKEWGRYEDPKLNGVTFNPYYWGDDEKEAEKPNLKFDSGSGQEIYWYKHPGRGQSSLIYFGKTEWINWFNAALEIIRKNDTV